MDPQMEQQIQQLFTKLSNDLLSKFEEKHNKLSLELTQKYTTIESSLKDFRMYVGSQITNTKERMDKIEERIPDDINLNSLKTQIATLQLETNEIKAKLDIETTRNNTLEKSLDDQVNRNLRKTLIFRGIKEDKNETWSQTSKKLATYLSHIDHNYYRSNDILQDIDRAHRASPKDQDDQDHQDHLPAKSKPIFVQFNSWKAAQYYLKSVINYNRNLRNPDEPKVYVDQMYSKEVTTRRKMAIERRKELRSNGVREKMFIKYPATLMQFNNEAKKYIELEKF